MRVRKYTPADKEALRQICRDTCSDEKLLAADNYLCTKYSDFYTETCPEHIRVLADEGDTARGYILCCPDWRQYRKAWRETYLRRIRGCGFVYKHLQYHSMWEIRHMGRRGYPAHLHIDIDPGFQRSGGGTAMMDALFGQLREEGVEGIYLGCGLDNEVGNSFYRHYGFTLYKKAIGRNIYTFKLK